MAIRRAVLLSAPVLDTDDCCPVDHAWLSLHRARCLAELGDLEQARDLAIEVQVLRNVAPHDPTAMTIMGASTDLIFTTSSWEAQKVPEAITGRDTLAAWWRTQEISWGLQHQFESNFKHWYQDSSTWWGASDQTWLHLRAASLIAGLAGDHSGWRHAFGLLARRVLTTTTTDTEAMAGALTVLRRVGDSPSVKLAAQHLRRVVSAPAARDAAHVIDLELSTRTSLRADLEMLRYASDVITSEDADRHTQWLLDVLRCPDVLVDRLSPDFHLATTVLATLAPLTRVISASAVRDVIEYLVSLPAQEDQAHAHDYAQVFRQIPDDAWTADDLRALAARGAADNFELTEEITNVLAANDPAFREQLRVRIAAGDLPALESFGDIDDLDPDTARGLVDVLAAKITDQVAELKRGQGTVWARDFAATLIIVNIAHPEHADWASILSLLATPAAFTDHLRASLTTLRQFGERVPDRIADDLVPILRARLTSPPKRHPFFGSPDIRGDAATALAAIKPTEVTDPELWELLNGDEHQRAAAVHVVANRNNPHDLMTLAAMAQDTAPWVRAMVANSLARWITDDIAAEPAFELLTRVLDDPGTLVAQAVVVRLSDTVDSAAAVQLTDMLREHISAQVRTAIEKLEPHS
ncbi:HEAT repeat domain-containing protein [Rhodococcus koreensis]|uniref:HEAT repeat-containing protein n=1 Tax=Rhodococcus koreensis TaxID=99653 RepID=A0A1H4IC88_9NOCA|nr:HEAT repeat domain-containing protein [Rhodococcus koreensis]SEB31641.1 hypothetical protein SAMN04490239_0399 [Rhodococcus koreensis]